MNIKLINEENTQGLSPIETVLVNRGIKREDIPHFLNTTDNDIINPLHLKNMEKGVKMLVQHLMNNDKILIQFLIHNKIRGLYPSPTLSLMLL